MFINSDGQIHKYICKNDLKEIYPIALSFYGEKNKCGINGLNFKDEHLIKKMSTLTSSRGPDFTGFFIVNVFLQLTIG